MEVLASLKVKIVKALQNPLAGKSFKLFGSPFKIDNWALSKFVNSASNKLVWQGNEVNFSSKQNQNCFFIVFYFQVLRTRSSALDVAFSIFGNDDTTHIIVDRMMAIDAPGMITRLKDLQQYVLIAFNLDKLRDGKFFHPSLTASRQTIDEIPSTLWRSSMYQV